MKKIGLVDQTEYEVYNIACVDNALTIEMLNADSNAMEAAFSASDNLAVIQYYVGTELIKGYAGYTALQQYSKKKNQTISTDYNTPDTSTSSGFAEKAADVLALTLIKPEEIEVVSAQTKQNRADIDYIAMETGVEV